MITQTIKLRIIKPLNTTWEEFGQALRNVRYYTAKMCNYGIQLYWEHHHFRSRYKEQHGNYPKDADIYGTTYSTYVYHKLRELYPKMAASSVTQTNQFIKNRWQTDLPEIMRLQKSIPSFKLNTPIHVSNQGYKLCFEENSFLVNMTLLSREAEIGRFTVLLDIGDKSKKIIFQRMLDGTYKRGAMQVVNHKRKRKWFCIISYSFTKNHDNNLDPNKIMGIDMGIVKAVYWAFSNSPKRGKISGGEISAFRRRVEARRKEMLRVAGRKGHGRKRRIQPTDKLRDKINNFRDTINHKYSKRIVDIAKANKCGVIHMEKLSGIEEGNLFLKNWTYGDLQNKIAYKAKKEGIGVYLIDPYKTSQTCSECGHVSKENREDQATFICKECGVKMNADYNAAKNIIKAPTLETL